MARSDFTNSGVYFGCLRWKTCTGRSKVTKTGITRLTWPTVRPANGWPRAGPSLLAFGVDIPEDSRKTPLDDAGPAVCEQLGPRMPHYPMSQPESYGAPLSWDQKSTDEARDPASVEYPSDVTEVARTLAAHGGGAASLDLALDLVLNEVVEQARSATGAKGAAIAFAKGNEMVCRATTGDAPELGVRLETTTGLSGACLLSGAIQQCCDSETDPRVDAEDCRTLGVRSILMVPLSEGNETFGVFEAFSSRPNAFGDRDVNTAARSGAPGCHEQEGCGGGCCCDSNAGETSHLPSITQKALLEDDQVEPPDGANLSEEVPPGRREVWTSILGCSCDFGRGDTRTRAWMAGGHRLECARNRTARRSCVLSKRKSRAGFSSSAEDRTGCQRGDEPE